MKNIFKIITITLLLTFPAIAAEDEAQANTKAAKKPEANTAIIPRSEGSTELSSRVFVPASDVDQPFGANLFSSQAPYSSSKEPMNPNYQIVPGDDVDIQAWGAVNYNSTVVVDNQGNIFLPEIGPVHVQGVTQAELNSVVKESVNKVYKDNVEVYTSLRGSLPVSIFVTGAVKAPGRYVGVSTDSVIDYIYKAGGIDADRGSYRNIKIVRNNIVVQEFDIYSFLLDGTMPKFQIRESDTILVTERGQVVGAKGAVKNPYKFEFTSSQIVGADLINLSSPLSESTNVKISGTREGKPFKSYVSLEKFAQVPLVDGDNVEFVAGTHEEKIEIAIRGRHKGPKNMVVPLNARLIEVLNNVPIDKELANIDAVYIKRKSVSDKQKHAILDSIKRLEETLLLARATGATSSEADSISDAEASLLERFAEKAKAIKPEGKVVVTNESGINNIALEEGDEIIIPQKTDLVMVNGEVLMPQAIVWQDGDDVSDYIEKAGGFSDRANHDNIVVIKANGETQLGSGTDIAPGDEIMILPEIKLNNLEVTGKVVEILYKVAIAAAIPFTL